MTKQNSQIPLARRRSPIDPWSIGAAVVAALVLLPIAAVVWIALHPDINICPHLLATTQPR